jgi:hypothetical protein
MSTPTSFTPFVGAELEQLMLLLSRSAYVDGRWQPLPDESFNATELTDGLALVLNASAPTVAGAVFVAPQTGADGQLHLSAAAWHTLMLKWPQNEVAQLTLLAAGAVAVQQGAEVVSISLTGAQWTAMSTRVAQTFGLATGQSVTALLGATPPAVTDLGSLHAAITQALNDPGLVLLERTPLDESNRYGHFAVAVNQISGSSVQTVLLSRALLESIRAIWPDAIDLAQADILGGSDPIGVVRLDTGALRGMAVNVWIDALVQRGAISTGQVVNTDIASDPASLADFNNLVRRDAFPSSFLTPSPGSVVMGDARRSAVLAAALATAGGRIQQAAAWLDLGRQALEEGVVKDGWIALDAQTNDLIDPALWPARNAVLLEALRLGGQVRKAVTGLALSGQLDRAIEPGETLSVAVGDEVYSSAQGGGLVVTALTWSLTLDDDASDAWRDVVVSRSLGNEVEVIQRFEVLDQQVSASTSVAVQAAALGRWYGQGSADLGQALASLLQAAATGTADSHGLDLVNVTALNALLLDPALQRVLASQGFTLPAAAVASQPADNAAKILAQGTLLSHGSAFSATRETLQAWAAQAGSLGGYGGVPQRAGAQAGILPPVQQLDPTERAALNTALDATRSAIDKLSSAARTALAANASVNLGLNLPAGSTYTLEISTDDGATWTNTTTSV